MTREPECEPGPECWCRQTDADEWDAKHCPAHGPHSDGSQEQLAQEAAAEARYWQGGMVEELTW